MIVQVSRSALNYGSQKDFGLVKIAIGNSISDGCVNGPKSTIIRVMILSMGYCLFSGLLLSKIFRGKTSYSTCSSESHKSQTSSRDKTIGVNNCQGLYGLGPSGNVSTHRRGLAKRQSDQLPQVDSRKQVSGLYRILFGESLRFHKPGRTVAEHGSDNRMEQPDRAGIPRCLRKPS
jgi:hypothetical protein